MRFLLLALPVFAFLPHVIPAYSGEKKCRNKLGHCRTRCRNGEALLEACKTHQVCCISASAGSQEAHGRQVLVTSATLTWDAGSPGPIDVVLTIMPTGDYEASEGPYRSPGSQTTSTNVHGTRAPQTPLAHVPRVRTRSHKQGTENTMSSTLSPTKVQL